ncbi:hypothetical protein JY96_18570 [Aquabacterium sp. NJ1]|uniref:hypothetical protein n=1 Tax=Aquabacterium sp. NJ1 TaxID=1538295 RepID=UPI00052B975F|nr:hypothetical protein [Aquabacterium sp. NJ1]KGM41391.1 hypothetical protein JY96_18570 [Aquabacterium sp. NJ1]
MVRPYTPMERTSAAIRDGFDRTPETRRVGDGQVLVVYRAHGSTSQMIGRFYFTPQICGIPRMNWTADLLERELNAALWGNDFKYLAKFRVLPGVNYKIGPIAQDSFQGVELRQVGTRTIEVPFDQYAYFKNMGLFHQVQIDMTGDWRQYLDLLETVPINPGRFLARSGHC